MKELLLLQSSLQKQAKELLNSTPVLELLGKLGKPIQTGSSVTGLMVYPDIDFTVQSESSKVQDAIDLVSVIFEILSARSCKITDFKGDEDESAVYFIGFQFPYGDKMWQISATVGKPGPIMTNPPELSDWIKTMSKQQREVILEIKKNLIDSNRYAGAGSQPPYTFRSIHIYESVLKGGAKTIQEVEAYFKP